MNELVMYPDSNIEQDELDAIVTKLNAMKYAPIERVCKIVKVESAYKEKMTRVLSEEKIIAITRDVLLSLSSVDKNYHINEFNCILDDMYDRYIPIKIKSAIIKTCGMYSTHHQLYLDNVRDLVFGNVIRNLVFIVDNVPGVELYDNALEISREQYSRSEYDIAKTFTWLYPILAPTFILRPYRSMNILVNESRVPLNLYKEKTERHKLMGVYDNNEYQFIHYEYFNPDGTGFVSGTVYNEAWQIITDIVDVAQPIIGKDAFLNTSAIIAVLHAYLQPYHYLRYIEFLSPFIYLQIDATNRKYGTNEKYKHINENLRDGIKLSSDRQLSIYTRAYKYRGEDGKIRSSVSDENGCSILTVDMLTEDGIIWDATFQSYKLFTHRVNWQYYDFDKKILQDDVKLCNRDSPFHKHGDSTDAKKYGYYIDYSLFNRNYSVTSRDIGDEITIDLMCREIIHNSQYIAVRDKDIGIWNQQQCIRNVLEPILLKFDNMSAERARKLADSLTDACWPRFARLFPTSKTQNGIISNIELIQPRDVTSNPIKNEISARKSVKFKQSVDADKHVGTKQTYGGKPSESFLAFPRHISLNDMFPNTDIGVQHAMYADILSPNDAYYTADESGYGFDIGVTTDEWRYVAHAQYAVREEQDTDDKN